jgi:iron(II)-dependent oxidoreductase
VDIFRLFPWGDALDQTRCNIWSAGYGSTLPVHAFENGAAPNGLKQLIGNVWEWVSDELEITTEENWPVAGEMAIMGTRGGAFDTYFETQATGLFRTGHVALTRTHNVGFRCAVSLDDASWFNVGND